MARLEMTLDSAETVAIEVLSFIAGDPVRLDRFLALTGINPDSLRDAAGQPNFLLGVLDYVAADDRLLQEFATQREIAAEIVVKARELLARASPATR
jgi:Protein of unknown function (DUF3572)